MRKQDLNLNLFVNRWMVKLIRGNFEEKHNDRELEVWIAEYLKGFAIESIMESHSIWGTADQWLEVLQHMRNKLKADSSMDWTGEYLDEGKFIPLSEELENSPLVLRIWNLNV